jgi:hypothetical protein
MIKDQKTTNSNEVSIGYTSYTRKQINMVISLSCETTVMMIVEGL